MTEQHPTPTQQITGQVRSMFYLVDKPTTILTIQCSEQLLTAKHSDEKCCFELTQDTKQADPQRDRPMESPMKALVRREVSAPLKDLTCPVPEN